MLNFEEFNCTSTEISSLVTQIRAQQSVEDIKIALKHYKKLKGLGSCEWIKCKFWCNEDFQPNSDWTDVFKYIRKYNDVGCDEFTKYDCRSCPNLED